MIALLVFPIAGGGKAMTLTECVTGAHTNATRSDWVDIYTYAWPEGITADMSFDGFLEAYSNAICAEPEEEE